MQGDSRAIRYTQRQDEVDYSRFNADQLRGMLIEAFGWQFGTCVIVPAADVHMPQSKEQEPPAPRIVTHSRWESEPPKYEIG